MYYCRVGMQPHPSCDSPNTSRRRLALLVQKTNASMVYGNPICSIPPHTPLLQTCREVFGLGTVLVEENAPVQGMIFTLDRYLGNREEGREGKREPAVSKRMVGDIGKISPTSAFSENVLRSASAPPSPLVCRYTPRLAWRKISSHPRRAFFYSRMISSRPARS